LFFDDCHQLINGDGNPDLGFDGILGRAIRDFDSKVLLDPFEEQFDLPAALKKLGDGQGG